MNEEKYFEEIRIIENQYYSIIHNFELNFPQPLNLQEEKKKFFRMLADDKVYNPFIKYQKKEFNKRQIKKLEQLKISTRNDLYGFKKLYKQRLQSKKYEIKCHQNWGSSISTKYVIKYRGKPSLLLLSRAKVFCRSYKRQKIKFRKITQDELSNELKNEVVRLTGDSIKVSFVDIASKMNINPKSRLIKINPYVQFNSLDLKRLKIHEIGVHYMRYYNAKIQGIEILKTGTSNYIETEEGLAVYAEEEAGVLSKAQMFIYAGRVIATYYSLNKSFYEVFEILKSYGFEDEDAFLITFRAKRNISDTSKKGGFTKDYVYFSGYLKIKKYAKRHNIRDLFIGKIRIEDVKCLKKFIKKNKYKIKTELF